MGVFVLIIEQTLFEIGHCREIFIKKVLVSHKKITFSLSKVRALSDFKNFLVKNEHGSPSSLLQESFPSITQHNSYF